MPKKRSSVSESSETESKAAEEKANEDWIFTVSGETGEVVKVETENKLTGERKEMSAEEYSALLGTAYHPYRYTPYGYSYFNYDPYAGYDPYSYHY